VDPSNRRSLAEGLLACTIAVGALLALSTARALIAEGPTVAAIEIAPAPDEIAPAPDPRRAALVDYLSERYRRAAEEIGAIVDEAHAAGEAMDIDPLLILAVMAIESSLNPAARSPFGAKGLMQIVPRFHRDKLAEHGGERAVLDPRANALVGTRILKDYVHRTGSLRAGLQRYAGWQDDPEHRYARRVLAEKQRLSAVVSRSLGDHYAKAS
jgi:soluble lytic murein transglycosylase-like protein